MCDGIKGGLTESAPAPSNKPIAPYMAVGLSTVVHGIGERKHIDTNLRIVEDAIHAAVSVIAINMPVKLIAPRPWATWERSAAVTASTRKRSGRSHSTERRSYAGRAKPCR